MLIVVVLMLILVFMVPVVFVIVFVAIVVFIFIAAALTLMIAIVVALVLSFTTPAIDPASTCPNTNTVVKVRAARITIVRHSPRLTSLFMPYLLKESISDSHPE